MLECYHPTAKITTPYLDCQYLGLKDESGQEYIAYPDDDSAVASLPQKHSELSRTYSTFKPVRTPVNRVRRGSWLATLPPGSTRPHVSGPEIATQDIYLDEGELFSQLCVATNVVKEGPRKGFFISHVNMLEGFVRVWRQWLLLQATEAHLHQGTDRAGEHQREILWVDAKRTIGLIFKVEVGPTDRMPLITGPDDEMPVHYTLVYEGKIYFDERNDPKF